MNILRAFNQMIHLVQFSDILYCSFNLYLNINEISEFFYLRNKKTHISRITRRPNTRTENLSIIPWYLEILLSSILSICILTLAKCSRIIPTTVCL